MALPLQMLRPPLKSLVVLACVGVGGTAWAGEFERVYRAALEHEATFQSAKFGAVSAAEAVSQARSSLLPNVSATLSDTVVQGNQDVSGVGSTALNYRNPRQSINLRTPLYNPEAQQRYSQAQMQQKASQNQLMVSQAGLLDRLTIAYLQRLLAQDSFDTLHAQVRAVVEQRNLMRQRMERGEGTRTEFAEARANLGLVTAQWADARDQVTNTQAALETLAGLEGVKLPRLGDTFSMPALNPATLGEWQTIAAENNPGIVAKRRLAQAAQLGVARAEAGHLPRVDLLASASNTSNETTSSLNQTISQNSLGLQVTIPIYSGGAVDSAVRQALAEQSRAESDHLAEQRAVALEIGRLFQVIENGKAKLDAYEEALVASRIALEGAQKSMDSGLRTNADVLEALRKVSQAERDLAQARYDHILQRQRLFTKAGMSLTSVVSYLDAVLSPAAAP